MLSVFLCVGIARGQTDSVRTLTGVEVGYKAPPQGIAIGSDGTYTVSSAGLRRGIRVLGEADGLAAVEMLPGVSAGSDYSSGLSINGSDYSQNTYTLDGTRVFFPYHFGGIFSTFNSGHVSKLIIDGSRRSTASPYGIGGSVMAYTPDIIPTQTAAIANVGIMSSSATLCVPVSEATALTVSARASYLNALYGQMLQSDDSETRYAFEDYNLTLLQRCGSRGLLKVTGFYNTDRLAFDDGGFALRSRLHWHNALGTIAYTHTTDALVIDSRLSVSANASDLDMRLTQFALSMPSSVSQWTAVGTVALRSRPMTLGYRVEYTRFSPQTARSTGLIATATARSDYDSWLAGVGCSSDWPIGPWVISQSSRLTGYLSGTYRHLDIDASVSALYTRGAHSLRLNLCTLTQYMHNVGFSDIGLASNFYLPASRVLPIERSYGADGSYGWHTDGCHWALVAKAFWRRLLSCPEYDGDILGLLADTYDPLASVTESNGFNTGGDLTVSYSGAALSGWGGYSLAVCRRKFDGLGNYWVPSATEPLHSFKAFVQWQVSRRVSLSAYFVMSSGRRYTPVEAIFIVGGNVMTDYGRRNSAHLPLYHRLDLSATVNLPKLRAAGRTITSYINVSVLNAYGHPNIEMQYFTYNDQDHTIRLRRVQSLYRFMPSLSYTVEF